MRCSIEERRRKGLEFLLVGGALKSGIIQAISGGKSATNVARQLEADERSVEIVLRALASVDFAKRRGIRYYPTSKSRKLFLDPSSREYSAHTVLHSLNLYSRWLFLPEVIKKGKPISKERGKEDLVHFISAMAEKPITEVEETVDLCLERMVGAKSVLDLGGGPGTFSMAFARRGLRATLFELPEVIELVKDSLAQWKITLVAGDFNRGIPSGHYDIVFLGSVTHIYGPEENLALFKRIHRVLNPRGLIGISDIVLGRSPRAPLFAVNMLTSTERGGTWTFSQYREWLRKTGFQKAQMRNVGKGERQLITALKVS